MKCQSVTSKTIVPDDFYHSYKLRIKDCYKNCKIYLLFTEFEFMEWNEDDNYLVEFEGKMFILEGRELLERYEDDETYRTANINKDILNFHKQIAQTSGVSS